MSALEMVKKGKNFILYKGGVIKIENVRFSYPHLAKKYGGKSSDDPNKQGTPKYGIVAMLPKSTHLEAKNAIVDEITRILGENKDKEGNIPKIAADKKFIRNGDDSDKEAYAGHWTVSAREDRQPSVRNKQGALVTEPDKIEDLIQGGYWGHILIRIWYQDGVKVGAGFGKRVNAGLMGVQHIKDDETFGEGRIDDTDAWGSEGGSGSGDALGNDDDL